MPEEPVNKPLTPQECVEHVFHKLDQLLAKGICERCALVLMCDQYKIEYKKLLGLWLDRDLDGYEN